VKLLDVCELDSRALQLRHRRAHLPQAAVVAELQASKKTTDDAVRDARVIRDDLERVQKKADADVEAVKSRRKRDQERMDSGAISSAKDLERMQHELATLDRRISVLEDEELEVMEQLEGAQATVTRLEAELAEITEKLAVAVDSVDVETSKIDTELAGVAEERAPALEGIPEEAHRYMLGSRSAVDWILERYQVKTDKASGIVNDPNDWSREHHKPRYIIDLVEKIVTVSLETVQIVEGLPGLD
jgi:predicted  nucleic acid-binding Zn-ribbon protein